MNATAGHQDGPGGIDQRAAPADRGARTSALAGEDLVEDGGGMGCDPGVSFRTVHDPRSHTTHTVISNSSDGAWPITRRLDEQLAT